MGDTKRNNGRTMGRSRAGLWWGVWLVLALWVLPHPAWAAFNSTAAATISWFYAAAFSRTPVPNSTLPDYGDLGGLTFWTDAYLTGAGELASFRNNVYAIADFIVRSPEFQARYPASLTNEAFVTALYENMLGRAPDEGGLAFWVGRLNAGASRGTVLADFTNSEENRTSDPLRQAALASFIAFIAADADGTITPAEAATWLAQNPTLDGARVDGALPNSILRLTRTGPGFFSVTVAGSGETYCGPTCEELALEVPHRSTVRVDALPNTSAVLWSWGTLPCSSSEARCEFEVGSDFFSSSVTFAEATVTTVTFAVPATVESSFVDSNSGARVTIPAGATHSPSSMRLEVRTNARGEQVFSVEVLDPEAWTDGWHVIEIEMDLSASQMQSEARLVLQDNPIIKPAAGEVGYFLQYKVWVVGVIEKNQENRLAEDKCQVIYNNKKEIISECIRKETAVAAAHCGGSGAIRSCDSGRQPVVLVHGYRFKDGYLEDGNLTTHVEDDDYWEDLPSLLYTAGHAPYTFRWNTAQRFEDAARSLRQVVDQVRQRHGGKAPLIVAHSFGGLVARTYAQGLDGSRELSAPGVSELRGVVTIGTPHSGIFETSNPLHGARYPAGGDPSGLQTASRFAANFILNRCMQVSCYQAGRDVAAKIFVPVDFSGNYHYLFGVGPHPGDTIHAINYGGKAMKVPLYALLGLQRKVQLTGYQSGRCLSSLNDGDGLISWQGQRVHPALSCSGGQCTDQRITNLQDFLQGNNSVFESQVSELILGAIDEPDSDKRPGSSVSSFTGYVHGKATDKCHGDERQSVIKSDRHANPDSHDVLIAVKRILDSGGGENRNFEIFFNPSSIAPVYNNNDQMWYWYFDFGIRNTSNQTIEVIAISGFNQASCRDHGPQYCEHSDYGPFPNFRQWFGNCYVNGTLLIQPQQTCSVSWWTRSASASTRRTGNYYGWSRAVNGGQQVLTTSELLILEVPPPPGGDLISGRYQPIGAQREIIRDVETGLEWMRCSLGQTWNGSTCTGSASEHTFDGAQTAAQSLNGGGGYGGYTDWRVPSIVELGTLVYCSSGQPAYFKNNNTSSCQGSYVRPTIVSEAFLNTPSSVFWSASPHPAYGDNVWNVDFFYGFGYHFNHRSVNNRVRLVRGGP